MVVEIKSTESFGKKKINQTMFRYIISNVVYNYLSSLADSANETKAIGSFPGGKVGEISISLFYGHRWISHLVQSVLVLLVTKITRWENMNGSVQIHPSNWALEGISIIFCEHCTKISIFIIKHYFDLLFMTVKQALYIFKTFNGL